MKIMEGKKYLLLSLEDEGAKKLAGVLGNKSCKKIIDYLAETKEASEKDIAQAVDAPINTVEYNLKKLLESGLVEKTKSFFWSQKGKKIPMYRLSNKSIVISTKPKLIGIKSILPVALIAGVGALVIRYFYSAAELVENEAGARAPEALKVAAETASGTVQSSLDSAVDTASAQCINILPKTSMTWEWFLIGAIFALAVFLLLNWRKR
jgi:DNA-binding transcriptional ArsR family regulator